MPNGYFLIKQRETGAGGPPASLSAGQFAFNKVDSTLYLGTTGAIVPVGGTGYFVANNTFTAVTTTSGNWNYAYNTVNANSMYWQQAYTNLVANSASYLVSNLVIDGGYF